MTELTLGTYRNPPLAYVVAEVTIAAHYGVGKSLASIQDRLRSIYPRTIEEVGVELTVSPSATPAPTPLQMWRLLSADQQRGLSISSRGFSLHSTRYSNFEEFSAAWDLILQVMGETIDDAFVERIGLRYVDFIVPSEDHAPYEYLANYNVVAPSKGAKIESHFWASAFLFDNALVNARIGAPSPPGMLLPPNITIVQLEKPAIWHRAEAQLATGKQIGFIDTDCSRRISAVYDAEKLSQAFRELKTHVSATFNGLMSELARKEWV
jgi:uncharacterized protein (TIGR04255 family)